MRLNRLPLRARLVAGFVGAMIIVLAGAGAVVFWRVQVALDDRLNQDLRRQTTDLRHAATRESLPKALASLRGLTNEAQLLASNGLVLGPGRRALEERPLLTPAEAEMATQGELQAERGDLFSEGGEHLRILAAPIRGDGAAEVAVTAVRLGQRDEALRELLLQLGVANALALALASGVGYRLARAALDPVERYRTQAEQIAKGESGLRLEVLPGPTDEVTRLGTTLNTMLDAQQRAVDQQQQFIDDASHELRTPLATLSAEIDLALRKSRSAGEYEATLRRLATDTGQLIDLAEALLTVGTLGTATLAATGLAADELVTAAAGRARRRLGQGNPRQVRSHTPENLTVYADPGLLERALSNLVENAVRHGEGTISIEADHLNEVSSFASILTVHDEGSGISAGFIAYAAERFRRDEASRSGSGAGLGLSIVNATMTAHHGQLRVCSAGIHHCQPSSDPRLAGAACSHPATGTTVSLLLPGRRK